VGLPRGGVVVASEVAAALAAPLDILVVRKIGAPEQKELGVGAVVDGVPVLDHELVRRLAVPDSYLRDETALQIEEIRRREAAYRRGRPAMALKDRTVIVVDDGVATGASTRAALRAVRRRGPARTVLAVPVASPETLRTLAAEADDVVCLETPEDFRAVGQFYEDFEQTADEQVIDLLDRARGREEGRATT
jgi:predicted phosphoribosyltransferase